MRAFLSTLSVLLLLGGCPQSQPALFSQTFDGDWRLSIPALQETACLTIADGRIIRWSQHCDEPRRAIEGSESSAISPERVVWSYAFETDAGRVLVSLDATRASETELVGVLSLFTLAQHSGEVYDVTLRRE